MQYIAKEGRCFVFSTYQFNKRKDYPKDYLTLLSQGSDTFYFNASPYILNHIGGIISGTSFERGTILFADIDIDDITRYHWEFDAIGHYSRPDLFSLNVNEKQQLKVTYNDSEKE